MMLGFKKDVETLFILQQVKGAELHQIQHFSVMNQRN